MCCLGTLVWQGGGIRYNPAKIPQDAAWDLRDTFIHGALFGPGGTCATLPVVYVAIGRRLGYPLKLVTAWGPTANHLFCRWDGGGERFNVEVNATGVSFPPDDHYRQHGVDPVRERAGLFLTSKTPTQELANFLAERAQCWKDHGRLRECVDAFAWAAGLSPENEFYLSTLIKLHNEWRREVTRREPPGFPEIWLKVVQRRYAPGVPLELEQHIICLTMTHNLLDNQEWENQWWRALRQGACWVRTPNAILVDSMRDRLDFSFRFPASA